MLVVLFVTAALVGTQGHAQTQQQLEQRRIKIEQQLATTSRLLKDSRQSRQAALSRLTGVQQQIVQREELINLLRLQVAHVDESVARTEGVLSSMQADIDTLTAEYGRMARAALRQNLLRGRWAFLLSAESFTDAWRRAQYLKRYDENRRRQLTLIQAIRDDLAEKIGKLDTVRAEKKSLLADQLEQQNLLESELSEKNALLQQLQGDESRLRKELAQQRAEREKLDGAIAKVIAEATRKAEQQRAAKASAASKATASIEPARADDYNTELASDFANNRGKLPWPVERGFISKPYGKRPHPSLVNVQVNNNGVDIRTDRGAAVKAVFEGEVVGIQPIPGYHTMVILQHGNYYTVYSNLVDVQVKPGARVGTADVLGSVAVDASTDVSELHFEVWRERDTQNPVRWVRGLR